MKKFISLITVLSVIISMFSFAGVSAAEEVLVDESFENGFGAVWNFKNNAYAKEHITIADGGSDGQKSALFVDDTASTSAILYSIEFDTSEGDVFEMSADFKHVEGNGFSVYYKFKDSSNKEIYKKSFGSTKTEWTKASATATAPAGAVKFFLQITGGVAATGKTYIDNVKAVRTYNASTVEPEEPSENPEGTVVFEENFEGDMSQWTFANDYSKTNAVVTDAVANSGSKSFYVVDDAKDATPVVRSKMISGNPGDEFKITAYFKNESGTYLKIWTRFYDENGKNELADSSFGTNQTEWTLMEYTAVIPEGKSNLQLLITGAKTSVGKTYIDDITVVKLPKEEPSENPEETVVFEETFEGDMSQWTYSSEAGKETIAITDS